MKVITALVVTASSVAAFSPASFGTRSSTVLREGEYDLDYGKKNSYTPATYGDGGQGEFGAISPNNWRVPGTSPVGQTSWPGGDDGGDEPWFAEAVSTVSLDLQKAGETMQAFTKEAAMFKLACFCEEKGIEDQDKAYADLVGALGYDKFLESSTKQLAKTYAKLYPPPKEEKKAKKKAAKKAAKKE
mmetsp:Transcript_26872/g.63131  ORF Transcript_26872/g.63131 Transcript_26872/m.63131 type:complete len:187 (+) Transcript_26872:70-630(+)|eukprot:CAMPEP_0197183194 /NCGR_PEP_ID=MMETSP1423-20130617/7649_1 /TAXON_ID=476441 /ORGANISM="Pseudo-nitzschia heimii, Strain UNC1101" /LENGTH=186 /DNA_ID=CAMNT_0042633757 /DNA_START=49 /DNA_END=609 /DNA_ORIENTATION=-